MEELFAFSIINPAEGSKWSFQWFEMTQTNQLHIVERVAAMLLVWRAVSWAHIKVHIPAILRIFTEPFHQMW
jgi:hypothetical protein